MCFKEIQKQAPLKYGSSAGGDENRELLHVPQQEINVRGVTGRFSWPEKRFLVFSNRPSQTEAAALYRLTLATGETERLTDPPPEFDGDWSPHVSPNGRFLAFIRTSTWNVSSVYVLPLNSIALSAGPLRRIDTGDLHPSSVTWAGRNDELIFTAGFAEHSLWRISTHDNTHARRMSLALTMALLRPYHRKAL